MSQGCNRRNCHDLKIIGVVLIVLIKKNFSAQAPLLLNINDQKVEFTRKFSLLHWPICVLKAKFKCSGHFKPYLHGLVKMIKMSQCRFHYTFNT